MTLDGSHPSSGAETTATAERSEQPVVVASGLSKAYGEGELRTTVLSHCDVELYGGRLVVLMGPSGSGKSTLLHLLAGLDKPTTGTVCINGQDVAELGDARLAAFRARHMGFVLQRDNLIPALTLGENVAAPLILSGVRRRVALARADELLERVGLEGRGKAFPAQVSGGQSQRAAVARACAGEAMLLVADEPTGALDREAGDAVMALFRDMVGETRAAAIVATHDPRVAEHATDLLRIVDGVLTPG